MINTINVVYDLDGVLNQLNEYVFDELGISQKLCIKHYNIYKNTDTLSRNEMESIINMYHNAEIFGNLQLVPGARRIKNVKNVVNNKINVIIHSLCYNTMVKSVKREWIKNNLGLYNECVKLEVGSSKGIIKSADIVVEDSLEQLLKYDREVVKILINKTYNKHGKYPKVGGIIRTKDLNAAIDKVEEIVGGIV